jgi:HD-like signal output (HDOD) protein
VAAAHNDCIIFGHKFIFYQYWGFLSVANFLKSIIFAPVSSDALSKTSKIISPFTREKMVEFFVGPILTPDQLAFRDLLITRMMGNTALPALPTSFLKLQNALDDPKTTRDEILEIIATDTGIVSKILAVSQSVIYGGMAVSSLEEAVMRIGLKEVRKVALAGGVVKALSDFDDGIDWGAFWVRSIVVARLVETLNTSFHEPDGAAYLTGLLHDIGRIFLRHHFPDVYQPVTHKTEESGGAYEAEASIFGFTRAPISAVLCKKWGLDLKIVSAVQHQHHPIESMGKIPQDVNSPAFLACTLDLAVTIADMSGLGVTPHDTRVEDYTSIPSYEAIVGFPMKKPLNLDMESEIGRAKAMVGALMG